MTRLLGTLFQGAPSAPGAEHARRLRAAALQHGATEITAGELQAEDAGRWCSRFRYGDLLLDVHHAVVDLSANRPVPPYFVVDAEGGTLTWFGLSPGQRKTR